MMSASHYPDETWSQELFRKVVSSLLQQLSARGGRVTAATDPVAPCTAVVDGVVEVQLLVEYSNGSVESASLRWRPIDQSGKAAGDWASVLVGRPGDGVTWNDGVAGAVAQILA